jgi:hypothetical protein
MARWFGLEFFVLQLMDDEVEAVSSNKYKMTYILLFLDMSVVGMGDNNVYSC